MRFFGLKTCDTCRKAQAALRAAGNKFDVIDVRENGVEHVDLKRFYNVFGDALLNTRSTTWRNLPDAERERDPFTLLAENPTLMKRPVIEKDGELFLSWSKNTQSLLLG